MRWYDWIFCVAMMAFVLLAVLLHYEVVGGG